MSKKLELTSFGLHIIAMTLMLIDHLWATMFSSQWWMTGVGRLAFPIFAFMIAEGFHYTHDRKKYLLRMLLFAVISEAPFDLMCDGVFFYPFHQNVMWTFFIAILCMMWIEKAKSKEMWLRVILTVAAVAAGYLLGLILFVDYFGYGVVTVLLFYFLRGNKWYHYLGQFVGLFLIHWVLFGGMEYGVTLFGQQFMIPNQGFAVFALIFIWLYRGKQGPYNKVIRYIYYGFYPVHMLLLGLLYFIR